MSLRLGTGGGGFGPEQRFDARFDSVAMVAADLDDDGTRDLAIATHGNIAVRLNGCPVSCPGDLDASGDVGFPDLLSVLTSWGPCPASCPPDLDGDAAVSFDDVLVVLARWGPC